MENIRGYCPMGCGETLFLGDGVFVTCSLIGCPNPSAASDILEDPETEHIVIIDERAYGFSIQHPIRERLEGELFNCGFHQHMNGLVSAPMQPGRYRVYWRDSQSGSGVWTRLAEVA